MKEAVITCKELTKVYPIYKDPKDRFKEALHPRRRVYHEKFYALDDVSFDIYRGETVGIIGENGAGKSTLLKIITGVLTPTTGKVKVRGKISSILELGTGFNMELTGIENIFNNCSLMGIEKSEVERKLDDIIAFADIGFHINQPVRGYSSGMFARLAMAVAINIEPDVLIVDEALAVGDASFQTKCMTAFKKIQDKGTTILFVSHDISSVKSLCQRAIYLKDGTVVEVGEAGHVAEIYMNEMRAKNNEEIAKDSRSIEHHPFDTAILDTKTDYFNEEFDKRVSFFRHGTGEAKILNVEVVDDYGKLVEEADFNQNVKIKIYLESYQNKKISVNFHILDDKKVNIATCNFLQAGCELYSISAGERLVVEYSLNLPIQHNTYSITAMISEPIIPDVNISYIDVVPDSYVFKVAKRPGSVLWSKVDLFPKLAVTSSIRY